jgi:hypothetical protein
MPDPSAFTPLPGAINYLDPGILPTDPSGVGNIGFLPSGGGSTPSSGGLGSNAGNLAKSFGPLLLSLFGSNPYQGKAAAGADQLTKLSGSLADTGKSLTGQGQDALGPVLQYFKALAGGDRAALLEATAPDRARILDQYDTARKTVANTTPRGGGQAGAVSQLEGRQASDLVTSLSSARTSGANALAGLGSTLVGQGTQATEAAATTLDDAVRQFQQLSASKTATNADLGGAIGAMIPFLLAAF